MSYPSDQPSGDEHTPTNQLRVTEQEETSAPIMRALTSLATDVSTMFGAIMERLELLENQRQQPTRSSTNIAPQTPFSVGDSSRVPASNSTPRGAPKGDTRTSNWADRDLNEPMDYNATLPWEDEEEEEEEVAGVKVVTVSENTKKLLQEAFTWYVCNPTRKKWRERYGVPKSAPTRVPSWTEL